MTAMAFLSLTFCCIWPEGGGQDRNEECGWGLPLSKATDAVRQSSLASPRFCAPSGPGMTMAPTCCWYYLIPVDFLNLAHTFVYNLLNIPQITHFECVFIAKTLINTIFYLYTFGISPSKVCVCVCVCVCARSVLSNSLWSHVLQPTRLLCPCNFFRWEYKSGLPFPSSGIFPSRDQTYISFVSCSGRRILYHYATWETPSSHYCSTKMSNPQRFFPWLSAHLSTFSTWNLPHSHSVWSLCQGLPNTYF